MALLFAVRRNHSFLPVRVKLWRYYSGIGISPSEINQILEQKTGKKIVFTPLCVSNCKFGKPFTGRGVEISHYIRDGDRRVELSNDLEPDQRLVTYNLSLEKIYSNVFNSLTNLKERGIVRMVDSEDSSEPALPIFALTALLRFFTNIDYHQRSLQTLKVKRDRLKEIDVTCIIANHLIAPLVPSYGVQPNDVGCIVSSDVSSKPKKCPCGQDYHGVVYGNTECGSEELWYGRTDIIAFPNDTGKVSISVNLDGEKSYKKAIPIKNMDKSIVEGKLNVKVNPLLQLSVDSNKIQFCMQSITFSFLEMFYQKYFDISECKRVSLVPSIAFFSEGFFIYMYDHIHDVLLQSNPVLLWKEKDKMAIDPYAVLVLWMILNYLTLKPSLTQSVIDILGNSCGLNHYLTDARLENIEKTFRVHEKIKPEEKLPLIYKYIEL